MQQLNQRIINNLDVLSYSKKNKNNLFKDIDLLKTQYLNSNQYFYILKGLESDKHYVSKVKLLANSFGNIVLQNKKKQKFVHVTPNIPSISSLNKSEKSQYLRYHETNAGGDLHSDGPQLNTPPKYVFLACIKNSTHGGDNIIVNCKKIFSVLKRKNREVFDVLNNRYFIERRGFSYSNLNVFSKPIFSLDNEVFRFRYLRTYIEAAYKIKNINMPESKRNALDILDSYLNNKKYQDQFKLNPGEILIINNNLLAHGRTSFSINNNKGQRDYLRVWIK